MAIESSEFEVSSKWARRPVWVINDYHEPYKEDFRGSEVVIPPNGEKKVKMPFVSARRFLGQPIGMPEQLPNGQFKSAPKMLRTLELPIDELAKLGYAKKEANNELMCPLCGIEAKTAQGLSVHIGKMHADAQRAPVE